MSGTSASKFTASGTVPNQRVLGRYHRFKFDNTNPHVRLQAYSQYAPTANNTSTINIESRNYKYAGFRWRHTSQSTDINSFGSFAFQSFVGDGAGTDIFGFDGTKLNVYSNLDMGGSKIINLGTPTLSTDAATKAYVDATVGGGAITLTGNVTGSGTVGTPFATTIVSTLDNIPVATGAVNINSQDIGSVGNLGIGVASPTLPIQFPNTIADCKICLYQTAANSFQVFGFGVTSGTLKYSVVNSGSSHVFYCGASSTTSTELFRIAGSGVVTLQNNMNMNTNQINNLAMAVTPAGTDAVNVSYLNSKIAAGTIVLTGNVTGSGTVGTPFATTIVSKLNQIPVATGAVNINSQDIGSVGNLGIGVASPAVPLHFATAVADCKIALFRSSNNFQVYGFGVTSGTLKYSVDSSTSSHVFYCGASSTTSTELFRIHGSGYATVSGGDGTLYSRVPSAHISLSGGSSPTVLTGSYLKLSGVTSATSGGVQFTTSSNRITFTGSDLGTDCTGMVSASVTLLFSAVTFGAYLSIFKNGTIINSATCWGTPSSTAIPVSVSLPTTMVTLSPGDYLEIWIQGAAVTVTTQYLNLSFAAC